MIYLYSLEDRCRCIHLAILLNQSGVIDRGLVDYMHNWIPTNVGYKEKIKLHGVNEGAENTIKRYFRERAGLPVLRQEVQFSNALTSSF